MSDKLEYEILYPGAFAMAQVSLEQGQSIKAEFGAMVAMTDTIDVEGKVEGGLMGGVKRMLTGEKFFMQTLSARRGSGEVLLSPTMPGDISKIELDGSRSYIIQKDGFFASSRSIEVSATIQNLAKGLFSGEGFFVLKVSGIGDVLISSYGAIHKISVPKGREIVVDNNHLVAWPSDISWKLDKAAVGLFSTIYSGEGLVCIFKGPGDVFIQTRNPIGLREWIAKNQRNA